ncbi:MAG: bifunctional folylpolyglutamate synthase/dihydrofolate synthase [Sphingomonadales bacterium]
MDYSQTLDYLFSKLPMFSRIGAAAYKNDLHNTIALCDALGRPDQRIRTIHVAGTNGKGSVSHMLASVLQSAGYRTGLYTSPHLYDFRERIKVNGKMIEQQQIVDLVQRLRPMIEKIEPSFFEVTVAMAFEHFAQEKVDIAVIETGLGGRLDSTNVITPVLSVITNIDWDHMQLLGDSLEKIAAEKAGIIKPGVPVVIGEATDITLPVFRQKAQIEKAPVHMAGINNTLLTYEWIDDTLVVTVAKKKQAPVNYVLDLPGIYQTKNILTVLEAIAQLQKMSWTIPEQAIVEGLRATRRLTGLGGRWQKIGEHPTIIVDVAHNEAGIRQVIQQLRQTAYRQLHLILGVVNDKSIESMLSLLPKEAVYYYTKAQLPRALPENELQRLGTNAGLSGLSYSSVNEALTAARSLAVPQDLILICGSIFLAAEVNLRAANGQSDE